MLEKEEGAEGSVVIAIGHDSTYVEKETRMTGQGRSTYERSRSVGERSREPKGSSYSKRT